MGQLLIPLGRPSPVGLAHSPVLAFAASGGSFPLISRSLGAEVGCVPGLLPPYPCPLPALLCFQ